MRKNSHHKACKYGIEVEPVTSVARGPFGSGRRIVAEVLDGLRVDIATLAANGTLRAKITMPFPTDYRFVSVVVRELQDALGGPVNNHFITIFDDELEDEMIVEIEGALLSRNVAS